MYFLKSFLSIVHKKVMRNFLCFFQKFQSYVNILVMMTMMVIMMMMIKH